MNNAKYYLRRLCAIIVGIVFFLSGITKLIDPVGGGLIVTEYFKFFHLGFLRVLAVPVAVLLSLTETLVGIALITNVLRKAAAIVAAVMMGFFTIVTLILWIANPIFDCGCFGEAVHLTHLQSLFKNIVLDLLLVLAYLPVHNLGKPKKSKYASFALVALSTVGLAVYSIIDIPLIDFTPFNSSSILAAAAGENGGAGEKQFISTFIYEKNGQRGVFTLNKLPDSTWTFVSTEVIEKENNMDADEFPVLQFTDADRNQSDSLAADGQVVVFSVYDPAKMKQKHWTKLAKTLKEADAAGFTPLLLLASSPSQNNEIAARSGLGKEKLLLLAANTYYSDFKTLISLNRSNGGATYFNDGNLIQKWSNRRLPEAKALGKLYRKNAIEVMIMSDTHGRMTFHAYLLYAFAVMFLL